MVLSIRGKGKRKKKSDSFGSSILFNWNHFLLLRTVIGKFPLLDYLWHDTYSRQEGKKKKLLWSRKQYFKLHFLYFQYVIISHALCFIYNRTCGGDSDWLCWILYSSLFYPGWTHEVLESETDDYYLHHHNCASSSCSNSYPWRDMRTRCHPTCIGAYNVREERWEKKSWLLCRKKKTAVFSPL